MISLVISCANLHYRVVDRKAGSAVEGFMKQMQQQMGVAMVGCAAYRNAEGNCLPSSKSSPPL